MQHWRQNKEEEGHYRGERPGEEGESENPQGVQGDEDELDLGERRMVKMLNVVKSDAPDVKLDFPMYSGKLDSKEVLDWIDAMDNYFEYKEVANEQKVKFAKTKLKGLTLTWWNYVQEETVKKSKAKISSRDRMVSKIKIQFLLGDHAIQNFRNLQNLKQKQMDVMPYTKEFHKLSIRTGHVENETKKIARYMNGLRFNIQNELSLATRRMVEECFQLATRA